MTTTLRKVLPPGMTWREAWLAQDIVGENWPTSVIGGHALTLANEASKATTSNGVHMDGDAEINLGSILNNIPKVWASFSFTLDQEYSIANSADIYLFNKRDAAPDQFRAKLTPSDGKLYFELIRGSDTKFTLTSTTATWNAGQRYHVLVSMSDTGPSQRMLIDGVLQDSDTQTSVNTEGDDNFVIGNRNVGANNGLEGVMHDFVIGTDDLTQTADTGEEALLAKGIPPADAVNLYTLDEGRGITATDRGSGADDGTLDSSCTWDYGSTKQNALSLDGIDDYADSPDTGSFSGDLSIVWIGKMESTYNTVAGYHYLLSAFGSPTDFAYLYFDKDLSATGGLRWRVEGNDVRDNIDYEAHPSIGDYWIVIGTLTATGTAALYTQGALRDTGTSGPMSNEVFRFSLGSGDGGSNYDVSQPIFSGIINGALSDAQQLDLTRYFNTKLNLGLTI